MSVVMNQMLIGLAALMTGLVVLASMIHFELGPLARLAGHRRWLLGVALGSGVVAFGLKLLLIALIARYPDYFIDAPRDGRLLLSSATVAQQQKEVPRYRWLTLADKDASLSVISAADTPAYVWQTLPAQAPAPRDNPTTPEKIALGKQLFFDKSLSRDGTLSCASCHDIDRAAGSDGLPVSRGIDGQLGPRNAPTVWNAAFQSRLFWDGRAMSLEEQAAGPMINPKEMGMPSLAKVVQRVEANPDYRQSFAHVFGDNGSITMTQITQAIAAYERTLITTDTPYDRFIRGDIEALTPAQLRGMALFQKVGCTNCHSGPNFSAASIFATTAPMRLFPALPIPEEIRYGLTRDTGAADAVSGRGVWRVPSLRNVALTGPWFHNGQITDLKEVVRIMSRAQLGYGGYYLRWSDRDKVLSESRTPALSDQALDDIVAFLHTLSSDRLARHSRKRE